MQPSLRTKSLSIRFQDCTLSGGATTKETQSVHTWVTQVGAHGKKKQIENGAQSDAATVVKRYIPKGELRSRDPTVTAWNQSTKWQQVV